MLPIIGKPATAAISLGLAQLATGLLLRAVSRSDVNQQRTLSSPLTLVISEIIKLVIAISIFYFRNQEEQFGNEKNVEYVYEHELEEGESSLHGGMNAKGSGGRFQSLGINLSPEAFYGLAYVAIAYAIASGVSHPLSADSESGFDGMIRASVVITTALLTSYILRSRFTAGQLSAVVLLMCGAAVLHFSTPSAISSSITGSSLLFIQTVVVAAASVYNQKIYQYSHGSFQLMNITLFGYSALLNAILVLFLYLRSLPVYNTATDGIATTAVAVLCNVLVGLASAYVLKYNDALVMYFVLSLSTGFLLCFEQFFTASISLLAIPGAGVIILATYQYFLAATVSGSVPPSPLESAHIRLTPRPKSHISRYAKTPIGLLVITMLAIGLCIPLDGQRSHNQITVPAPGTVEEITPGEPQEAEEVVISPFKNTVAFVRINHDLPEREQLIRKAYAPFFHTVHVSMPSNDAKHDVSETTPERDYWNNAELPYPPVKDLLDLLLEREQAQAHSNITSPKEPIDGLLYFHFDAWIEPLQFHDMPRDRLWILNSGEMLPYKCMRGDPYREPHWMWFENGGLEKVKRANRVAAHLLPDLDIDVEEFCMGWSDLYFIPADYFQPFISLASSYGAVQLFHEIALPTIWRIIERSYSRHPSQSVLLKWGDCYGGCCRPVQFKDEILENRCGHKLNYIDWETTKVHYDRMEKNRQLLGKPWPKQSQMAWENWT